MKTICKIDALGRIVIPKDMRKTINLQGRGDICITVENNTVILSRKEEDLILC